MKLIDLINDKRLSKNNVNILGLSENSKEVKEKYIFFLRYTKNFKIKYINEAIKNGAILIIHERIKQINLKKFQNKCLFYQVKDIEKCMSEISRKYYGVKKKSIKIYGVTGTNGKSSVVYYISQFLLKNNKKIAVMGTLGSGIYPKTNNNSLTTPNIIKICKKINYFCKKGIPNLAMEVSSHGLSQNRVYGLDFNTVIFTNLTKDHLDFHKNMKNYFNAKLKLFSEYNNKKKVVSVDNHYGRKIYNIYKENKTIKTVSVNKKTADYYANDIVYSKRGINFCINSIYGKKNIETKLYGEYTIENILLAIASIVKNKKEFNFFTSKIKDIKPLNGRLNKYVKKDFPLVFIDYAHTPDAIHKTLMSIKKHFPEKNIITIFGCGGDRSLEKRKIMGNITDKYSEQIIITNDNPRGEKPEKIANQILKGINKKSNYEIILDRREAIKKSVTKKNQDKIVLILGKGHEIKQIINDNIFYFSDQEEVLKAFNYE